MRLSPGRFCGDVNTCLPFGHRHKHKENNTPGWQHDYKLWSYEMHTVVQLLSAASKWGVGRLLADHACIKWL